MEEEEEEEKMSEGKRRESLNFWSVIYIYIYVYVAKFLVKEIRRRR